MNEGTQPKRFHPTPRNMAYQGFLERFGGVYERFPGIAERVFGNGLAPATDTPEGLAAAMADVVAALDRPAKLMLIRNHPDLAGRAAIAGDLTESSKSEQAGAGLDSCTPEEYRRFRELNEAYKTKFGFPFILAVTGKSRNDILAAFEARLGNDRETEFETALGEINKIALFRLRALAI